MLLASSVVAIPSSVLDEWQRFSIAKVEAIAEVLADLSRYGWSRRSARKRDVRADVADRGGGRRHPAGWCHVRDETPRTAVAPDAGT